MIRSGIAILYLVILELVVESLHEPGQGKLGGGVGDHVRGAQHPCAVTGSTLDIV